MSSLQQIRRGYLGLFPLGVAMMLSLSSGAANAAITCADPLSATAQEQSALALTPEEVGTLQAFYSGPQNICAWSEEQIGSLRSTLGAANDQGLDGGRYHVDALDAKGDAAAPARDLAATAMSLRYAHDLVFGQIDITKIETDIDVPRPTNDLTLELRQALAQPKLDTWLAGLGPQDPGYQRLVTAFRHYRDTVKTEVAAAPIATGPTLKLGDNDQRIAAVKDRLRSLGDLHDGTTGPNFDQPTQAALITFQHRHGIKTDGKLGRDTVVALNITDTERLQQIATNLERARYFAHVLPAQRIEVNTAGQTMQLLDHGRVVLAMRAVVGAPDHPTPMLISSHIDAIVSNPTWTVPVSIIKKEIDKKVAKDPEYLTREHMQWENGQLVQAAGPKNSLGLIKFDFPNPFSVYLHDTPARALFARDDRARSHGCVRLEKPLDLATELLKDNSNWPRDRLAAQIASGETKRISVSGPAVAFLYRTAFVDDDGTLEFRGDIYGRDERLSAALAGDKAVVQSAQAQTHKTQLAQNYN